MKLLKNLLKSPSFVFGASLFLLTLLLALLGPVFFHLDTKTRVGLAYSLNDKTVIRAAYGIFYSQGNGDRVDGGSTVMGFNQTLSSGTGVVEGNGLKAAGFRDAVHVQGGVLAWIKQIDPSLPAY